jgi:hypothetical protein
MPINDFARGISYPSFVMKSSTAERVTRLRARRRRGEIIATLRVDQVELRKLVALGYLDPDAPHEKGPALDAAVMAYFSDRLFEEPCRSEPSQRAVGLPPVRAGRATARPL